MPTSKSIETTTFSERLESLFKEREKKDPLNILRERAFDHFLELGLPEKNGEAFQYVSLKKLYKESFFLKKERDLSKAQIASLIYPECTNAYLVFVNGYFDPLLSELSGLPPQMVVLPMVEAMRSYGTFLQSRWSKTLKEETDPFAILNLALHPAGVFLYLPPQLKVERPLQCLFLSTDKTALSLPRLQFFLASQAELKILITPYGKGFCNAALDVSLENGAHFSRLHVPCTGRLSLEGEEESSWFLRKSYLLSEEGEAFYFGHTTAALKRGSSFSSFSFLTEKEIEREQFKVALNGENAEASLRGSWILREKKQAHTHILIEHNEPHCTSTQHFKGVLDDFSQSSFEGKIYVAQKAQKTEAYQLNHNLLLSDHAMANSKPNLEIFADDVKASHGATVMQVDKESLFYLRSRGIPEQTAKNLLIQGYIKEVMSHVSIASVAKELEGYVENLFAPTL